MDELRIEIWDFLYRASGPQSIDDIAESTGNDAATVQAAIDHEWFTVVDNVVAISEGAPEAS